MIEAGHQLQASCSSKPDKPCLRWDLSLHEKCWQCSGVFCLSDGLLDAALEGSYASCKNLNGFIKPFGGPISPLSALYCAQGPYTPFVESKSESQHINYHIFAMFQVFSIFNKLISPVFQGLSVCTNHNTHNNQYRTKILKQPPKTRSTFRKGSV